MGAGDSHTRPLGGRAAVLAWRGLGVVCVGAGAAGSVLPLVPTTPFLLVAAWAFARSSPRWRAWLVNHPRFGPAIRAWQQRRAVPRRAKVIAVASLLISLAATLAAGLPGYAIAIQAVAVVAVSAFLFSRPDS